MKLWGFYTRQPTKSSCVVNELKRSLREAARDHDWGEVSPAMQEHAASSESQSWQGKRFGTSLQVWGPEVQIWAGRCLSSQVASTAAHLVHPSFQAHLPDQIFRLSCSWQCCKACSLRCPCIPLSKWGSVCTHPAGIKHLFCQLASWL